MTESATALGALDATLLTTKPTSNPRSIPAPDDPQVRLLEYHTDHMITVSWTAQSGWSNPLLEPFGPLPISPAASALQFATECFEGMKLYRSAVDGRLRIFRGIENCERMRKSAARVALPDFEASELEKLIMKLCAHEAIKWLPNEGALYIRPTLLGTDSALAISRPRSAILCIFLVVFPSIVASAFAAPNPQQQRRGMKLLASDEDMIRAWPGGFGNFKVGANYGPALNAQDQCKSQGYDQVLWLFGPERHITEAGASNFFVVLKVDDKTWELVTPPLKDGIILPGITRASILQLLWERWEGRITLDAVQRSLTMKEIIDAHSQGRIVEAFVTGTALFVTPVGIICIEGKDLEINCASVDDVLPSQILRTWLTDIINGKEKHEWAKLVD